MKKVLFAIILTALLSLPAYAQQELDTDSDDKVDLILLPTVDEDNMSSDSAILLPTQQSVKAYSDTKESGTSNDFDPDRIAGDTTDDNLVDEAVIDADIARDSEVPSDDNAIQFIVGSGTEVITTGAKLFLEVPYACTISAVTLLADQSGSVVIDLWVDTYANYPPTVADTITASAKPTISTATKYQDATLTGWTKALSKGDILGVNVDSVATIQQLTVSLKVDK